MASQPESQAQNNSNISAAAAAAATTNSRWPTMVDGKKKTKKRVRNFTPADRAAHRVFEKSRREAFNDQLMELARLIPSISSAPRLSKHTIVNESIAYHRTQDKHCLAGIRGMQALLAERDELLEEVNSLRALLHPGATGAVARRVARPLEDEAVEFMRREGEIIRMNNEALRPRQDSSSTTSPEQQNRSPDGNVSRQAMQMQQLQDQQGHHLDVLAGGSDLLGDVPEDFDFWEDIDPTQQAVPSGLQTGAFELDTAINSEQPLPIPLQQRLVENNMFNDTPRAYAFPDPLDQGLIPQMDPFELSAFPTSSGIPEPTHNPYSNRTEIPQTMPLY